MHFSLIFSLHVPPILLFELQQLQNRNKKLILLTWFPLKTFGPWSWQFVFHWLHNCEWWEGALKPWCCKCMRHWGKHWPFDGQGRSNIDNTKSTSFVRGMAPIFVKMFKFISRQLFAKLGGPKHMGPITWHFFLWLSCKKISKKKCCSYSRLI